MVREMLASDDAVGVCDVTPPAVDDIPTMLRSTSAGPFHGGPELFVEIPAFTPVPDGNGALGSPGLAVWKPDDTPLSGDLSGPDGVGELIFDQRAVLAGLQRVPASIPAQGCWTLRLWTPGQPALSVTFDAAST